MTVATYVKPSGPGVNTRGEAAGLRWLAGAEAGGGVRVAHVIDVDDRRLVLERIAQRRPTRAAARGFGAALAVTHAAGASWLGQPPQGWGGPMFVGRSHTPLVPRSDAPAAWGKFYARYRIGNFLKALVDRHALAHEQAAIFERVMARLEGGEFDVPEPRLVERSGVACARLHGDLWAGNVLWADEGQNSTGAVLIDPMASGGHAETDLAFLDLFGLPYLHEVLNAYDAASPLSDGWRGRVALHQIGPLLFHAVLFGGGYLGQALSAARAYV